jgi:tetratricopeptide (TPR) repeat protein
MAVFGEEWQKRYRRRWWQKVIDVPLDLLALLLEWSGEDSWVHRTIGKHLDKPKKKAAIGIRARSAYRPRPERQETVMRQRYSQLLSAPVLITLIATACQPTPEAFTNRGDMYANQGQYDLAIAEYNRAVELNPGYAEAFNNRGGMYANKRQYDLAFADFNRALELNPSYAEAFNNRGFAYASQGQYEQAIADVNRALELNPSYGMAYNNRGAYLLMLGDTSKVCSDAKRGCALGVCDLSNEMKSKGVCP